MKNFHITFFFIIIFFEVAAAKNTDNDNNAEECYFSLEPILSGTINERSIQNLLFDNSGFESNGDGFKQQCIKEAKRYPKNIRLDCETIDQFNKFFKAKKSNITAAAIHGTINEIIKVSEEENHALKSEEALACREKIDSRLENENCSELTKKFKEIESLKFSDQLIFEPYIKHKAQISDEKSTLVKFTTLAETIPRPREEKVIGTLRISPSFTFNYTHEELSQDIITCTEDIDNDFCINHQIATRGADLAFRQKAHQKKTEINQNCVNILEKIDDACSKGLDKVQAFTDTEDYRKYLAAEFINFHGENIDEQLNEMRDLSILYSFNYYTCAQESYGDNLTNETGELIDPSQKAFIQEGCGGKDKLKTETTVAQGSMISSIYSNISLTQDELEEIERQTSEYLQSDKGKKAVAKAYKKAGLEVPKRYDSNPIDSIKPLNTISEEVSSEPSSIGQPKIPNESLVPTNIQPTTFETEETKETNRKISNNNKKINSAKNRAKQLEDQFAKNIANQIPTQDPKNQKIVRQLKELQEEIKKLRAENKRLAESQKANQRKGGSGLANSKKDPKSDFKNIKDSEQKGSSNSSSTSSNSGSASKAIARAATSTATGGLGSISQGLGSSAGKSVSQGASISTELGKSDFDSQYEDYRQEVLGGPYPEHNDLSFIMVIDDTDIENPVSIVYKVLIKSSANGEKITTYKQVAMGEALEMISSIESKKDSIKREIASEKKVEKTKIKPKEEKGLIKSLLNTLNLD